MDQTAREKRTLQFMRDGRVRLRIKHEEKNTLVKSNEQEYVNLHYSRVNTPKRVTRGGAHLRDLAPGLRSSEETLQR